MTEKITGVERPKDEATLDTDLAPGADTTLGAKVRHLIGVSGYRFGYRHTQDKNIAHYLGVAASTWARMKSGVLKADEEKLGLLTEYFRLDVDYRLTFEVFMCGTLEEFKNQLKMHRVGAYGGGGLDVIRSKLASATNARTDGISFERSTNTRAGGLAGAAQTPERSIFRPGETVTLRILHPEGGHLLVLNDGPDNEFVCLKPSRLAPRTEVHGRVTRLPTDESPEPVFAISGPAGRYRIYSIWSRKPFVLPFVRDAMAIEDKFFVVPAAALRKLIELIVGYDNAERIPALAPYEIRLVDYLVLDDIGQPAVS